MVAAINGLFQRVQDTLENERRLTDDAAHQLRTPLAAIQAQLYAARASKNPVEQQLALDQLQHSVVRAIRLVNQLLALARLNPRQAPPRFQSVSLSRVAERVCAELAPLTLQKDQTLEMQITPGVPPQDGQAELLSMLLSNLLDNAIHYTPQGGHILVQIGHEGPGILLRISDNGPGIPPSQRARVFERFYRVARQNQPGTGLGLAICQRISELHHAQIELSEGLDGRGLTVSVFFPL